MKFTIFLSLLFTIGVGLISWSFFHQSTMGGAPPYDVDETEVPEMDPHSWIRNWTRPDVPPTVGLQVGHWKNEELPDELERLRGSTGASGGGKSEWEVNMTIAQETKVFLEEKGIVVEILPATVPERYWADVFIAIHADGNLDSSIHGYKFAGPWRDMTGKADDLVDLLNTTYEKETGLIYDPNISRNMRGYYAFSWWRHDHAVHPMTTAVIAETGFLTNYSDRQLLINNPEIPAKGIADAVIKFLESQKILPSA